MTEIRHPLQTEVEGIHQIHNWSYAYAAARTGASGFTATDIYKIALQEDTNTLWMLTAVTPTWIEISGSSSVGDFTDLGDVPASYSGYGGYAVAVNGGETGLEFVAFPAGGGNTHDLEDSVTAVVTDVVTISHTSTVSPVLAGFGTGIAMYGDDAAGTNEKMGTLATYWIDPAFGSQEGAWRFQSRLNAFDVTVGVIVPPSNPSGASLVGNTRGTGAVDFQGLRFAATRIASGNFSFLLAGVDNTASGLYGGVAGGFAHTVSGNYSGILAGYYSQLTGNKSGIVGGHTHSISGDFAGILGGYDSDVLEDYSAIAGGSTNVINIGGDRAFIGGGDLNTINESFSGIIGGQANTVDSESSVIAGGGSNDINGTFGFIGAGRENVITANATYGAAFGFNARADIQAALALASGDFTSVGDAQTVFATVRRTVTHSDANWYQLYTNVISTLGLSIPTDTVWTFDVLLSGATAGIGKAFGFRIDGVIENDGGTTTLLASNVTTLYDTDDVSYDARVTADDTNDRLLIEVSDSDSSGDVVKWVGSIRLVSVTAA